MNLEALNPQTREWLRDAFDRAVDDYIDDPQEAAYAAQLTQVARDLGVPDEVLTAAGQELARANAARSRLGYTPVGVLPADPDAARVDTLTWAQAVLVDDITDFYDDPAVAWEIDENDKDVYRPHAYLDRLKTAAADLGVNVDQVVATRTSPYQRARIAGILATEQL